MEAKIKAMPIHPQKEGLSPKINTAHKTVINGPVPRAVG